MKPGIGNILCLCFFADLAHLVERDLAKVEVAGSSPVIRSIRRHGQAVRHGSAKPLSPVRFRVAPPKRNTSFWEVFLFVFVSVRTQHRLIVCGQHHFLRSKNIIPPWRTQNNVMATAINDVMLYINDVLPSAKMLLRLCRKYTFAREMLRVLQTYAILYSRR